MSSRVDLEKTKYKQIEFKLLSDEHFLECEHIYKQYIIYKKFDTIYPIFREDWSHARIFGYYHNDKLVAWSSYYEYPSKKTCHADQFAWNYEDPSLKLGYKSLRSECAYYKEQGFKYLILGDLYSYKQELKGFEAINLDSPDAFET
jgi:hypothetical protein|tara:strand:+ start:3215 stop:3652 length:438 start_codon:yes stop_codon:yes gene_type:complete